MFPNMQQENGAISYNQYIHGHSIASKEILDLISDPASQIFGGIPEWVYPIYSILMVALLTILIIRYCRDYTIPVMATALYILLRFTGKAIFASVGYPTSYVPVTLLFIPLGYLLIRKDSRLAGLVGSLAYFLVLYLIHTSGILITPPLKLWELVPVAIIGVLVPAIYTLIKPFPLQKTEKKVV
jgi:hypothetical protein